MTEPVIRVEQGELEGGTAFTENKRKYYYFKGIPYAEPPVGKLRFKPPVPINRWDGRKIVKKEGNKSPQIGLTRDEFVGNEDCLFLNVYSPSLPKDQETQYPVMVFLHGGGFRVGCGDSSEFGPDFFIEKYVILVTLNYRIGALGFLCLENADVPGNAGLRDQNLALQWIQKNIQYFNGDPFNVTLFGVSAGSVSAEYQILSPMSRGLFHKAILESGSLLNPWTRNRRPKEIVNKLTNFLGITASNDDDLLKQLQKATVEDLIKSAYNCNDDDVQAGELFGYAPVVENIYESVDGFLTSEPIELLKSGDFSKIPTIVGFCSNEGGIFKANYIEHDDELKNREYAKCMKMFKIIDKKTLNKELTTVYDVTDKSDVYQLNMFLSDLLFISGIYRSLLYRLHHDAINFCYMFSYDGNLKLYETEGDGTMHGAEIPYLYKMGKLNHINVTPLDQNMRNCMISMWTNFAKYGNPTPEDVAGLTKWLPIREDNLKILNIDVDTEMQNFPWMERMNLWNKLFD